MLNFTEHEIYPGLNVKMPTLYVVVYILTFITGFTDDLSTIIPLISTILIFMSSLNFMLS